MNTESKTILPQKELDAFARCFYPYICAYFKSEKGETEYAEYLKKNEKTKPVQ